MTPEPVNGYSTFADLLPRLAENPALKQRLLADPTAVLRSEGVAVPPGVTVQVFEDTSSVRHVILPADLRPGPDCRARLADILKDCYPIPEDGEVRLAQDSDTTLNIVIPHA